MIQQRPEQEMEICDGKLTLDTNLVNLWYKKLQDIIEAGEQHALAM